jgi:hypothetical protein
VHPDWNIHFLLLEPGGTKTNFMGSSMRSVPVPPEYKDPNLTVNKTLAMFSDEHFLDSWASSESVVRKLLHVLKEDAMPLRLCTGNDAFGAIKASDESRAKEMEKWKHVSLS